MRCFLFAPFRDAISYSFPITVVGAMEDTKDNGVRCGGVELLLLFHGYLPRKQFIQPGEFNPSTSK
ncbi:MAG: hypothetical protein RBS07_07280 [Lentimicrobium sp.]|jgi:hypothetical protein|nr:hypothetical protein [Lentimicrobium sp.]